MADLTHKDPPEVLPRFHARDRDRVLLSAVMVVTLLAYLRCLRYGFVWDYEMSIVTNRYIERWSFLSRAFVNDLWWFYDPLHLPQSAYYRPLENVWLGLLYHLFGKDSLGWHLTSVILSLVVVYLVFKIGALLVRDSKVALLAALLFGLLPVHAEAVVWSVPTLLTTACQLAAFYFFFRPGVAQHRDRWLAYLCYGGALLTHESAAVLPVLIVAYAVLRAPQSIEPGAEPGAVSIVARLRSALWSVWPFAVELAVYLSVRIWVLGTFVPYDAATHLRPVPHLIRLPAVIANYLMLLVFPWRAGPAHQLVSPAGFHNLYSWLPIAVLMLAAVALLLILKRHPRRRLYLFCALWIGIGLAPVLILPPDVSVRDRYLYLPSFGWCLMLADLAMGFAREGEWRRRLVIAGAAGLMSVYAVTLWQVQRFWHDDVTLFTRCIAEEPESYAYHKDLGVALAAGGEYPRAEQEFLTCLRLEPHDPSVLMKLSKVHWVLGRYRKSAQELAEALAGMPNAEPADYMLLAKHADAIGDAQGRDAALERLEKYPRGARDAGLLRARLMLSHRDSTEADEILTRLITRYPHDPELLTTEAATLLSQNRYEDALAMLQRVTAIDPIGPEPHFLAAVALHRLGRDHEALDECRLAAAGAPDNQRVQELMSQIERSLAGG